MADFVALSDDDLDGVAGGVLRFRGGKVYSLDDPNNIYYFNDYDACKAFIEANWGGAALDDAALQLLESAGLIWR